MNTMPFSCFQSCKAWSYEVGEEKNKTPSRLREWLETIRVACLAFLECHSDFMVPLLSPLPSFPVDCNCTQYIKETIHAWEFWLCASTRPVRSPVARFSSSPPPGMTVVGGHWPLESRPRSPSEMMPSWSRRLQPEAKLPAGIALGSPLKDNNCIFSCLPHFSLYCSWNPPTSASTLKMSLSML